MSLGANTRVFSDSFDDESQWRTVTVATGDVSYDAGSLTIAVTQDGQALSSWHTLSQAAPVQRVEGSMTLTDGVGAGGLMCGTSAGRPDFLYGVVISGDPLAGWALGQVVGGVDSRLAQGPMPADIHLVDGGSARVAVECAMTGQGGARIALWVDGELAGDTSNGPQLGLFDTPGLYASTPNAPYVATFDDVVVSLGDAYQPVIQTHAVTDLLRHVPAMFRTACSATLAATGPGVLAGVSCAPAGPFDRAEYYRYDTSADLRAAFVAVLARSQTPLTAPDCDTGPADTLWHIPGQGSGRLACFDAGGGRLVVWTDEATDILAIAQTSTGSYVDLGNWWLATAASQ